MIEKIFECEADRNDKYFRVIHTMQEYSDGRRFPINEIVISDKKVDLNATELTNMGGFCISTYECIFRWLIRGDTLCEVEIPEDSKIYKTGSDNGIYLSDKIILRNPRKIDDDLAMELYLNSKLPERSYFITIAVCAICGYMNTALEVCTDKVNKDNIDVVIYEFEEFCKRREKENYITDVLAKERVEIMHNKLKQIQKNK